MTRRSLAVLVVLATVLAAGLYFQRARSRSALNPPVVSRVNLADLRLEIAFDSYRRQGQKTFLFANAVGKLFKQGGSFNLECLTVTAGVHRAERMAPDSAEWTFQTIEGKAGAIVSKRVYWVFDSAVSASDLGRVIAAADPNVDCFTRR